MQRDGFELTGLLACLALPLLLTAACRPSPPPPLQSADLAGEYRGKVQIAPDQPKFEISLSLRTDGSFVGDFPDPHLTWGGHRRAIGRWKVAKMDGRRGCLLVELSAEGRRARAHCASRESDGRIGINCAAAAGGLRSCEMIKVRAPAARDAG